MPESIAKILQEALSAQDYALLQNASSGRLADLFAYDAAEHRFEPAERHFKPDELEAVLRASEVLTGKQKRLRMDRIPRVAGQRREKDEVQYRFGPGEAELYTVFRRLLEREMGRVDGVMIDENVGLDGPIITITIASTTENEYHQVRDHLKWLYELASRSVRRDPYRGSLPY